MPYHPRQRFTGKSASSTAPPKATFTPPVVFDAAGEELTARCQRCQRCETVNGTGEQERRRATLLLVEVCPNAPMCKMPEA